jgi:hypothetical protein
MVPGGLTRGLRGNLIKKRSDLLFTGPLRPAIFLEDQGPILSLYALEHWN